jgi:hypothetical protein
MPSTLRTLVVSLTALAPIAAAASVSPTCSKPAAAAAYAKRPLAFEPNAGQLDDTVRYLARGRAYTLWLTPHGATLRLSGDAPRVVRMELVRSNDAAALRGEDRLTGVVNDFRGDDPARWRSRIPTFRKVRDASAYPGIDLVYYGHEGTLEYDFVVASAADPSVVALRFTGIDGARIEADGGLRLDVGGRELRWRAPESYQTIEGRHVAVASAYRLVPDSAGSATVGFSVPAYDRGHPLVIDPLLDYSTFLGGAGTDQGYDVAVDDSNHAYVTGSTASVDFPLDDEIQAALKGSSDAFVTKLTAAGDDVVYSTYLGGRSDETGTGIAVGTGGVAYVTGFTSSNNFPTTPGALDVTYNGLADAFVVKLDSDGQLSYGTYVGTAGNDYAKDIAQNGGRAYVAGYTDSNTFPTTMNAFSPNYNGGPYDGFVFKLGTAGATLMYSTYLGGSDYDYAYGIALSGDEAVVTGQTWSLNFPTLAGFDNSHNGAADVFVTRLTANGQNLVASTFLGGDGNDSGEDVALGDAGNVFVTGWTDSNNFPTSVGAYDRTQNGNIDAFVVKLDGALAVRDYGTYVGGSGLEQAWGIAVNTFGGVLVTGDTGSTNFPTVDPIQATHAGGVFDAFVFRLTPEGDALNFSTYLGSPGFDFGEEIALDGCGLPYVVGVAASGFPTTPGAFDTVYGGGLSDAFVAKITP